MKFGIFTSSLISSEELCSWVFVDHFEGTHIESNADGENDILICGVSAVIVFYKT